MTPGSLRVLRSGEAEATRLSRRDGSRGCRGPSGARQERAADDVDAIGLDDVVDLEVIEVGDLDPAFKPFADFLGVVLEAFERFDASLVDLAAFADQPGLGGSFDRPLGHEAAGDGADLRDPERLTNDRAAEVNLLDLGDKAFLDGLLDLVGDLINDVVTTDVDFLLIRRGDRYRSSNGATRKPMTIACEASAKRMSLSEIPPTPLQEDPGSGSSSFSSSSSSSSVRGLERPPGRRSLRIRLRLLTFCSAILV